MHLIDSCGLVFYIMRLIVFNLRTTSGIIRALSISTGGAYISFVTSRLFGWLFVRGTQEIFVLTIALIGVIAERGNL